MAKAVIQNSDCRIEYIEPPNVWFPTNNNQEKMQQTEYIYEIIDAIMSC